MATRFLLAVILLAAVSVMATAASPPSPAHAQGIDDSLPPLADLSIVADHDPRNSPRWRLTVRNNRVGSHPGATAILVRVEITRRDADGNDETSIWTIRDLRVGSSATMNVFTPAIQATNDGPARAPMRLHAKIIETDPAEPPGFQHNNETEHWAMANRRPNPRPDSFTNGNAGVGVSITGSDRFPPAEGATTFTVHATNDTPSVGIPRYYPGTSPGFKRYDSAQLDVRVKISLSPGLSFSSTQQAPSGTTFDPDTGVWDVGAIEYSDDFDFLSLPVAVNLTAGSLADLPLEERCLTAEVVRAVPWFALHHNKREDDITTVCLGEDPKVLLAQGTVRLFYWSNCVGNTAYPCTSADTLELLVLADRSTLDLPGFDRLDGIGSVASGLARLQPETVVVHVDPSDGRLSGIAKWATHRVLTLRIDQRGFDNTWSGFKESVTVSGVDGAAFPGRWRMRNIDESFDFLDATSGAKVEGLSYGYSDIPSDGLTTFKIEFDTLGTYVALFEIEATKSMTKYTDSGTYTFHVGPVANLEVEDGGARPELSTGQRAYTVMALNNGPDVAPDARVTLTGVPENAEAVASEGSYTQGACQDGLCQGVWSIGELRLRDARRASGLTEGPTLTLITEDAGAAPITAAIANNQDYSVCIDSDGDDVDAASEAACKATSGNTWHSTEYYDHIPGNNTEAIEARAGTGEGHPDAPTNLRVVETPVGNIVMWEAVETVNGHRVTHYQLQRSGSPWTTVAEKARGTVYADMGDGAASASYRARAVGTVGSVTVKSGYAYALATENYPSPGAPRDFAAKAASDTEVTLSWNAPEAVADVNLTGYELEVSFDRGVTWTSVATASTLGSGATSHTHDDDANPLSSKPRQYRLKAVGTVGGSQYESGWVFAVPAGEVGPPQNLAATAVGSGRINLAWGEPGFGADRVTGYRIDYALGSSDAWQTLEHGYRTIPRSYQHTGLTPGREYCYRVAATYAGGTGPFAAGDDACATTESEPRYLPGKPENLRFAQVGRNFVVLEWDPPGAGGEVEYYQWRSNIHDPQEVKPETATSVTVRGLEPSWSYGFQVRAGNSHGTGQWSREVRATLNLAGDAIKATPQELEVDKGGSGSFNVRLSRAPQWPLLLYLHSDGAACLTEGLPYQQGRIMLPTNPSYPSKEFWEDPWWGPPGDRLARPWNSGLDILMNAAGCRGGDTAVVHYDLSSLPFSYLEGLPMWEELGLDQDEWREKWGTDRLDGATGPGVKVTVEDGGNIGGQQSSPGAGAAQPTAVDLALDAATVSESAGEATLTATLDAPAPEGGIGGFLFAGADGTASQDIDFTMPLEIFIPGGQRSATAAIAITGDDLDEADETVVLSALFDLGTALLEDTITLTIADDDTAGVRVSAASGLALNEDGSASYTVVLDSQPTADVTIVPFNEDETKVLVTPGSNTFTPSDWHTPLTFTVRGLSDGDRDDESVLIRLGATSADPKYAAVQVNSVPVSVSDTTPEQQGPLNQAPTVASAISDGTIVNESGIRQVSLNGLFDDADGDAMTITAGSSDTLRATVSVASDQSSLTVTAQGRGTAIITVTADDGRGGTVSDAFTITVKAAPVVASAISDVSGMGVGDSQDVPLSAVFDDADGDALTFSADTSDPAIAEAFLFQGILTVAGLADGSATITVTAQDSDGNAVRDTFNVKVVGPPTPVSNLSCIASTGQVLFQWDVPEWSGAEVYAYDYDLTLPDGRNQQVRLVGYPTVRERGEYQVGAEASISVKAVYELADGSEVSSEAVSLTCTVAE